MLGLELNFAVSIPCRPFTWFFMKNCEQRAYPPLQGLECKAVQAVLKHPAFVEALYALLKPYSKAVPALAMTIQELARKLSAAAGQLCFVQRCYTRLSFSDSCAVRAQSQSLAQVSIFSANLQDYWLFSGQQLLGVLRDSLQTARTHTDVTQSQCKHGHAAHRVCLFAGLQAHVSGSHPGLGCNAPSPVNIRSQYQLRHISPHDGFAYRCTSSRIHTVACFAWRSPPRASRPQAWWRLP